MFKKISSGLIVLTLLSILSPAMQPFANPLDKTDVLEEVSITDAVGVSSASDIDYITVEPFNIKDEEERLTKLYNEKNINGKVSTFGATDIRSEVTIVNSNLFSSQVSDSAMYLLSASNKSGYSWGHWSSISSGKSISFNVGVSLKGDSLNPSSGFTFTKSTTSTLSPKSGDYNLWRPALIGSVNRYSYVIKRYDNATGRLVSTSPLYYSTIASSTATTLIYAEANTGKVYRYINGVKTYARCINGWTSSHTPTIRNPYQSEF